MQALSLAHYREFLELNAPPVVNALRASGDGAARRAALRDDLLAALRPFFVDGAVRQECVLVRARRRGSRRLTSARNALQA